jgi:hypothetical protein
MVPCSKKLHHRGTENTERQTIRQVSLVPVSLVPKLCLGTHIPEAPLRIVGSTSMQEQIRNRIIGHLRSSSRGFSSARAELSAASRLQRGLVTKLLLIPQDGPVTILVLSSLLCQRRTRYGARGRWSRRWPWASPAPAMGRFIVGQHR